MYKGYMVSNTVANYENSLYVTLNNIINIIFSYVNHVRFLSHS